MISATSPKANCPNAERASRNFTRLMGHVVNLYCSGASSSVSAYELRELTQSVLYALGLMNASSEEAARVLAVNEPIALWREAVATLGNRVDAALEVWREVVTIMPPIRNVALRDTLASLGGIKQSYDVRFAAHEVPCNIDYQLHKPVDPSLMGVDYIEAWLLQLREETQWIAQFRVESCISVLERICPDYRGLHVNLCDLLLPYEDELARALD